MPSYKYKGLLKGEKERRIEGMLSQISYPEERAKPPYYYNAKHDSPAMLDEKKKRRAEYAKTRTDALKKDLDNLDVERVVQGMSFPKGQAVEVSENSPIISKLNAFVKSGSFVKEDTTGPVKTIEMPKKKAVSSEK